jgi:SP family sugar:H+ symporter-like MFS transporter
LDERVLNLPFSFYYGTTFFQTSGISNPFLISIATNVVNVGATPASWWMIERLGRRKLLIYGSFTPRAQYRVRR